MLLCAGDSLPFAVLKSQQPCQVGQVHVTGNKAKTWRGSVFGVTPPLRSRVGI